MAFAFTPVDIRAVVAAALTFVAELCAALASSTWLRPGPLNFIWLIGIPVAAAFVAFKSRRDRLIGASALITVGFAGTMAAAYFLPAGYR